MEFTQKSINLVNQLLNPQEFIKSCKEGKILISTYPNEVVENLSLNDALLIALFILSDSKGESIVTYSEWYAQIFILFPSKFGISSDFPMLLDSEKINKRWRDLKTRGLIEGSRVSGWSLTRPGRLKAQDLIQKIGHPEGKEIIQKTIYTQDINFLLKKFEKVQVFHDWNGIGIPPVATMNEISSIIGISVSGKRQEFGRKLLELIDTGGLLDQKDERTEKAKIWLIYQCLNLRRFMGEGSTFTLQVNKLAKELGIESL